MKIESIAWVVGLHGLIIFVVGLLVVCFVVTFFVVITFCVVFFVVVLDGGSKGVFLFPFSTNKNINILKIIKNYYIEIEWQSVKQSLLVFL